MVVVALVGCVVAGGLAGSMERRRKTIRVRYVFEN
jgi:hypothetical protein